MEMDDQKDFQTKDARLGSLGLSEPGYRKLELPGLVCFSDFIAGGCSAQRRNIVAWVGTSRKLCPWLPQVKAAMRGNSFNGGAVGTFFLVHIFLPATLLQ